MCQSHRQKEDFDGNDYLQFFVQPVKDFVQRWILTEMTINSFFVRVKDFVQRWILTEMTIYSFLSIVLNTLSKVGIWQT